MTCEAVQELAADLALGIVEGPERAAALAHLDECRECRELVDSLARTGDALLLLAPGGEPAPGFETRVVDRLGAVGGVAAVGGGSRRWWLVGIAAAVALVVGITVTLALGSEPDQGVVRAAMRSPRGDYVGDLVVGGEDDAYIFLAVPGWEPEPGADDYAVRIDLRDGSSILVEDVSLDPGEGTWGTIVDAEPDDVTAVAMLGHEGRVWCSAELD